MQFARAMNSSERQQDETQHGLSSAEARLRLARDGYNELPSAIRRNTLAIALSVAREPMFLLLIASAVVYFILGDVYESLVLSLSVIIIFTITIFQERKTERALDALRDLSSPRALVIRDGEEQRIAGREVVCDDVVILTEGDRVPADAVILSCNDLRVDESLLTGESMPVRKAAWDSMQPLSRPGGDDLPFVFSGTMLVQGRGVARVTATGIRTELGKIGKALQSVEADETFLQKKSAVMIRTFAAIGLTLCALAVGLYGFTRGDWLQGVLAGAALAMSLLPEEIPVVLTVFLAIGAWRMSQKNVLTRRMPAIEALGATTVLCVDKTGTLTLNRMSVRGLFAENDVFELTEGAERELPARFQELVRFAVLASETHPFDPMEKAFMALGDRYLDPTQGNDNWVLVHEYSITPGLLALSHVWKAPDRDEFIIAAKGAPEAIVDLCHLSAAESRALAGKVEAMASQELRVLAVAKANFLGDRWPDSQHDFNFTFLGLIGLADPVRPEVPSAIAECHRAGVRVVMITGDYPATARAIADQIHLESSHAIVTGSDIEQLSETELRRRIARTTVFARVLPEQKLRLVETYKANGEIVAMTGDGVNDAPALQSAHIGIAMGGRGTDVAREAAALVLLDDNFATIVAAIRSGRRIFDNLQKAMAFIFAIHVPIAGVALVPLILHWPLILTPVHIVFLELIIDPACSIAFEAEPEEMGIMARPPRDPKAPLFGVREILLSLGQGAVVLTSVLFVLGLALYSREGDSTARALTFTTLVFGLLSLITVNRSWSRNILQIVRSPNAAYRWVMGGAIAFLAAVFYLPFLRSVFRFAPLSLRDLGFAIGAALAMLILLVVMKRFSIEW
jgi:Ca2+-transporting ATPase